MNTNKSKKNISIFALIFSLFIQLSLLATPMVSQAADLCDNPNAFGNFEVGIPGAGGKGTPICAFITDSKGAPFLKLMSAIINVVTVLTVIAGLIMIIVGAYFIMLAGGDSSRSATGKTFIKSALFGIALALTAYLILNTISGQFTPQSSEQEPVLILNCKPGGPNNGGCAKGFTCGNDKLCHSNN